MRRALDNDSVVALGLCSTTRTSLDAPERTGASLMWHPAPADRYRSQRDYHLTRHDPLREWSLLEDRLPTPIMVESAAVGSATGHPAVLNRCSLVGVRAFPQLCDDLIAVVRVHRGVLIPMEHNRRGGARNYAWRGGPSP